MLLGELRKARLEGGLVVQTPPKEADVSKKLSRLSIGPAFLDTAPISSPKRRSRNKKNSTADAQNAPIRRKRMKNVGLTLSRLVPVEKFPDALLKDNLTSKSCPWDAPPDVHPQAKSPSLGPFTPENDWGFDNPSFSPQISRSRSTHLSQECAIFGDGKEGSK